MFLKKENTDIGGNQVDLNELSGLQRIEYLEYLTEIQKMSKSFEELPNEEKGAKYLRLNLDVNAWLISRSLWHNDNTKQVDQLKDQVLSSWSPNNIYIAAAKVMSLSGLNESQDEESPPAITESTEGATAEEAVPAEKY
ncbi:MULTISPECIES: phage tail assembly chaperone G [unclassified Symbiopectobacterium]|uniref:phage tail assembly chaperone G n=1 Tax=unclassified Symbiopectobacterium TaxID=2794573 RepID=UPI002226A669|nr:MULTISPECIES: phage minor tail protein G [unclassified Symbiopectobacterium]MCW2473423.1 phage minor tail protein G [Candidatus Symbiopectobacterium sp. NZEC151]MCW2482819.1 phage minor tail protein G [Candidatus Symbiopectobacterium sp. NZEC135]